MQTKKLLNLFTVLLGIFMLCACEYATITADQPVPPPPPPGDSTSFSLKVQPIFDKLTCARATCHNGNVRPDLRSGKSYQSLMDDNMVVAFKPAQSVLYTCLNLGGSMAPYGNTTDNGTIYNWILEGAKNN
jgi:hypothetical protein